VCLLMMWRLLGEKPLKGKPVYMFDAVILNVWSQPSSSMSSSRVIELPSLISFLASSMACFSSGVGVSSGMRVALSFISSSFTWSSLPMISSMFASEMLAVMLFPLVCCLVGCIYCACFGIVLNRFWVLVYGNRGHV